MARTDFTASLEGLLTLLSNLDTVLSKVSPKLANLTQVNKNRLLDANELINTERIVESYQKLQLALDDIVRIKKDARLQTSQDIIGVDNLKYANSELDYTISRLSTMRDILKLIDTMKQSATAVGLTGGVHPFTQKYLEKTNPDYLKDRSTSTAGNYLFPARRIGLGANYGGYLGPLETGIHELGHHVYRTASANEQSRGISPTLDEQMFAGEKFDPSFLKSRLAQKFRSAGILDEKDIASLVDSEFNYMTKNISEMFANEFSNFALTGKTIIPGFEKTIATAMSRLDKSVSDAITKLVNDMINRYVSGVEKDVQVGELPPKATYLRLEAVNVLKGTKNYPTNRFGQSNEGEVYFKEQPTTLRELGEQADLSKARVNALRETLQKLIQESVRGGTGTQQGIARAMETLAGGGELTPRQRVGGGAYLTMAKAKREEIVKKSQELNQAIEELNKIQNAIENVGKTKLLPPPRVPKPLLLTAGETNPQQLLLPAPKQLLLPAPPKPLLLPPGQQGFSGKLSDADAAKLEEFKREAAGQNKTEEVDKLTEALNKIKGLSEGAKASFLQSFNPIIEVMKNLGLEVEKVSTKVEILDSGLTKLSITVKNTSGSANTFTQTLTKTGEVYTPAFKAPEEGIGAKFPGLTPAQNQEMLATAQPILDIYKKLGLTLEHMSAGYSVAEDGTIKFTLALKDNLGVVNQVNSYLIKSGEVLNQVAYSELKAAEAAEKRRAASQAQVYTEEQIVKSLGEQRSKRALELAKGQGFGIEQLRSVYTQAPAQVSFLKFSKEVDGVVQKLEVTVDRFGNVLTRTNRRLLGFFDSIVKNTGELIKWSVGVGLVYGSYYKLQQLIQTAIDNEVKLATVTVTLGETQRTLRDIFDDVSTVARQTGETISEVLESYTMAYRAVGAVADPIQRTTAANKLLYDSTILNKIGNMSAADSIDVLSGALRQLQQPNESVAEAFQRGTELLDKWVATSRRANVDVATLATAFSVTSESATNAGLSIEQLNAVIAVLSEKIGGLGGKETGNAVRALIGGIYQQQASEALGKYGVAVKDTAGNMRDFLSISKDIYDLFSQGIIKEDQLNKIGYAWGGGVRRGQQVVAFLSDYRRILDIVAAQEGAEGSAQSALAKRMDVTQTAVTQLGNAFQEFAQALGNEGGVLEAMTGILHITTSLVEMFDKLTQIMGRVAIPAALLGITRLLWGGEVGGARYSALQGRMGLGAGNLLTSMLGVLPSMRQPSPNLIPTAGGGLETGTRAESVGALFSAWMTKRGSSILLGTLAGAFPAISRAGAGDLRGAGITIGAAAAGALAGGPVGGIIGSAIAEAFLNQVDKSKGKLADLLISPFKEAPGETPGEPKKSKLDIALEAADLAAAEALKTRYKPATWDNRTFSSPQEGLQIEAMWRNMLGKIFPSLGTIGGKELKVGEITGPQLVKSTLEEEKAKLERAGKADTEQYRKLIDALDKLTYALQLQVPEISPEQTRLGKAEAAVAGTNGVYKAFLDQLANEARTNLRTQSMNRDIKPTEYRGQLEYTYGLPSTVARLYTVLSKDQKDFNAATDEGKKKLREFSDTLLGASQEDRDAITTLLTEMFDLSKVMDSLKGKAPDAIDPTSLLTAAQAAEKYGNNLVLLQSYLDAISRENLTAQRNKIKLPSIEDFTGISVSDMGKVVEEAKKLQDIRIKAFEQNVPGWTDKMSEDMIKNADPVFAYLGQLLQYYLVKGISDPALLKEAMDKLTAAGKITKQEPAQPLGYQFMSDVTRAQMAAIEPQYQAIRAQILAAGGTSNEDPLLTYFKDSNSPSLMTKDWKIVQYLLQQILNVNEKQLDGLYNLPSEATFYVPSQALKLAYNAGLNAAGGGGGGSMGGTITSLPTPVPTPPTAFNREAFSYIPPDIDKILAKVYDQLSPAPAKAFNREPFSYIAPEPRGQYVTPDILRGTEEGTTNSLLQDLLNTLKSIFSGEGVQGVRGGIKGGAVIDTTSIAGDLLKGVLDNATGAKSSAVNLKLDISTQTQLLVDGRALATIIKQYLWEDLVRFDATGGGSSSRAIAI